MTTIVIISGGYHPYHAGHYALYQSAQRTFPDAEVYVAATNDTSTRPFPFPVKEKLARLAGVEPGHFVQVKSPFRAEEITAKFDPSKDVLIFVRSEKDQNSSPMPGGVKKDGSASYLQPLLGAKKLEPFARHAYMAYLPTVEFGPGMTSATEIRAAWPQLNEKRKTALVMSLYPRTQNNAKLAATVVGLLDVAIGTQGVAEGFPQPGQPVVDAILKVMPISQEIWFHGSRATGKHRRNSDTDILVVVPDDLVGDQYLAVVRILQKLSSHFANYDIQPTKAGNNIHRIAQEEGRLLWSNKPKQSVAETSKQKGVVSREYDRDPELRQALLYAKQHYPQHANNPEQAMLKWLQRGLKHSEQEDRQHDQRIAQLNSKVSALIASITQLKQQQNQVATENNNYMDE